MSLRQTNHLMYTIHIPWKTFVKESSNIYEKQNSKSKEVHQLGFQGDQAKLAYEKITNEESETNSSMEDLKYVKSKTVGSQTNTKPVVKSFSTNSQLKKNQSSENISTKVTINMILRAIEEKDIKFLRKHMTLENVNLSDSFGWTPLMSAAYCGHLEIVEFLLHLGANKRAREKSGLTAAQLALKKNYLGIVALLRKTCEFACNKNQSVVDISNAHSESILPLRLDAAQSLKDAQGIICDYPGSSKEQSHQNNGFYCEICQANFHETTPRKHQSSTLHIFNTKPKLPSAIYGISKQNKGYQMLLNTGWDEDVGLGPSGKGIKYPIKTCLKTDRKGLGLPIENEARITHFKPGDISAVSSSNRLTKQKPLKKRDREKLLNREARKERALRIALS